MLKILQARLQQYVNREFPDVQAGFRKGRGTRDQIANICWIIKKAREFQKNIYFCFIDYAKAFDCVDPSSYFPPKTSFWSLELRPPCHLSQNDVCLFPPAFPPRLSVQIPAVPLICLVGDLGPAGRRDRTVQDCLRKLYLPGMPNLLPRHLCALQGRQEEEGLRIFLLEPRGVQNTEQISRMVASTAAPYTNGERSLFLIGLILGPHV